MLLPQIILYVGILAALVVVYAIVATIVRYLRERPAAGSFKAPATELEDEEELPAPRCSNCMHFDFAEGQAIMRKHPLAMEAYRTISPNMAMTKRDKDGKELPLEKPLSAKDDSFDTLGACMLHEQLRIGADKCEKWSRAKPKKSLTVIT